MKKANYPFSRLLLCFLLPTSILTAQNKGDQITAARQRVLSDSKVETVEISKERSTPSFIYLKGDAAYSSQQAGVVLNNYLNVRPGTDLLKEDKQTKLDATNEVVEFQQYFRGIKVDRAKFKAFVKNGSVKFYNGSYYSVPSDLSTQPKLSEEKALGIAKAHLGATKFASDEFAEAISKTTDSKMKAELTAAMLDALPNGELVLMQDFSKENSAEIKLSYKFNIYATKPLNRSYVYVDAQDGHILLVDPIIKHFDKRQTPPPGSVTTTVQTRYAGNRTIYVKQISGNDPNNGQLLQSSHPTTETYVPGSATYVLTDDTRGNGVETYDLNAVGGLPISVAPAYTAAKAFTDVDNNWTLPEHKRGTGSGVAAELENDDIAWDAHWGAEVVYDYWKNKHNRQSFDGKNGRIRSYIHSGAGYDNAFWNGTVMTYGDGSYPAPGGFKALTSLDVCGHEIGHGVCSSTSDLVYANESGAMNEALSDIWASCIEYYAIKQIDPSLASVYKPFYIGEQISADPAHPLRRMDSPQAEGNPDTYGGKNWTKQPGCTPTLANDECGVHNNSGVLNKWFYLITVGSGAGSGPDAAYAGTDDGVTDSVAGVHPAYAYAVTGLGFNTAEKITFLMETMLSSTATYDEARTTSIAAATQISGSPCSAMVETVTNAWYAVGVGNKFVKPCTTTFGFVTGNTSMATSEAAETSGCGTSKTINIPILLPAGSKATIAASGTATNKVDFNLPVTGFYNPSAGTTRAFLPITVFNDGSTEGDETIILTATISNLGANPVNNTFTLTIMDDDVVPVISTGAKTLLSETFTRADGFNDPSGWTEVLEIPETSGDPLATGKNQWGIFDNRLAITGKEGTTNAKLANRTYNNASESRTLIKAPMIDARGLNNLKLKFDYVVQGEVDPAGGDIENFPAFDYMAVAYSFDGVKFIELTTDGLRQFASANGDSGTVNVTLPASFNNKQFYLAFKWYNDANAGGPVSVSIDNLSLTASGKQIENDNGNAGFVGVGPNSDSYVYSDQDNQVLIRIANNSTQDEGCTWVKLARTGIGGYNMLTNSNGTYKAALKDVFVKPATKPIASHTVSIFFAEDQIAGLENFTKKNRSALGIFRVDTLYISGANSGNTTYYPATFTAIPGIGGYFTASYTGPLSGFFTIGAIIPPVSGKELPVAGRAVPQSINTDWKVSSLYPNPGRTDVKYNVNAPSDENVKVEIVTLTGQVIMSKAYNVTKGITTLTLPVEKLATGNYFVYVRNHSGEIIDRQKFMKQ